jgi:hypothetical protein
MSIPPNVGRCSIRDAAPRRGAESIAARTSHLLFDDRTSLARAADFGKVPDTSDTPGVHSGKAAPCVDLPVRLMVWVRNQFLRCPAIHGETVPATSQPRLSGGQPRLTHVSATRRRPRRLAPAPRTVPAIREQRLLLRARLRRPLRRIEPGKHGRTDERPHPRTAPPRRPATRRL